MTKNIAEQIKKAENAVKDITDPELKKIAFQTILEKMLGPIEKKRKDGKEPKKIIQSNALQEIAKKVNLSEKEISKIIEQEGDDYNFFIKLKDSENNENKLKFLILLLTTHYFFTSSTKLDSSSIRKKMSFQGFTKINNLSIVVKHIQNYVRHNKGPVGSTNTSYAISTPGIGQGLQIIKELTKGKGLDDVDLGLKVGTNSRARKGNLTNIILNEIGNGFFDSPKNVKELKKHLETKGKFYQRNILDEKLRRRFLGEELTRIKQNKKWNYVKKP